MITKTLVVLAGALVLTSAVNAGDYSFTFNPADLLNNYPASPAGDKSTQDNARKLISPGIANVTWQTTGGQAGNVYDNPAYNGRTQPDSYNTYLNWLDSLGANEGVSKFDFLIAIAGTPYATGDPRYPSWGPHLLASPTSVVTVTAPGGWTVSTTVPADLAGVFVGAEWTSLTPVNYIRPGGSFPAFSFTVTGLLWDGNSDGIGDRPAGPGDLVRVYFSTGDLVFDANGWGSRPGYGPFGSAGATWEGVLTFEVPEPGAATLLGLCAAAYAWCRRRKR